MFVQQDYNTYLSFVSMSLINCLITIDKLSNISYTKNVPMRYENRTRG